MKERTHRTRPRYDRFRSVWQSTSSAHAPSRDFRFYQKKPKRRWLTLRTARPCADLPLSPTTVNLPSIRTRCCSRPVSYWIRSTLSWCDDINNKPRLSFSRNKSNRVSRLTGLRKYFPRDVTCNILICNNFY